MRCVPYEPTVREGEFMGAEARFQRAKICADGVIRMFWLYPCVCDAERRGPPGGVCACGGAIPRWAMPNKSEVGK